MTTTSSKVRALYAAGVVDPGELSRRTGASRQLVAAALRRADKMGRPVRELVKIAIAVPAETEQWIREQAARAGCSFGDVVHGVVEAARTTRKGGKGRSRG